jgi:hypothetical protein
MPFLRPDRRLVAMIAQHQSANERECSLVLRSLFITVLIFCALGILFFAACSIRAPHALRMALEPFRSRSMSQWPQGNVLENRALETVELSGNGVSRVATEVEHFIGSTSYTVHVRLSSGDEQSLTVTAPPGGLEFEVRDMTGDAVVNDLVLRPAVIHWPLIVLLNDGHDHFKVAITASLPNTADSGCQASRRHESSQVAALVSVASKIVLPSGRQFLNAASRRYFLFVLADSLTDRSGCRSLSGRAPPTERL